VQVADEEDADGDEDEDPEDEAKKDAGSEEEDEEAALEERIAWDVRQVSGAAVRPVWLPEDRMGQLWQGNGRVLRLGRTRRADAVIVESGPRATATRVEWQDDGVLVVEGDLPAGFAPSELALSPDEEAESVTFPVEVLPDGRFAARLTPARVESLAGPLPLRAGRWDLFARTPERDVPVTIARELYERIPMTVVVDHKPFTVGLGRGDQVMLQVQRDLADDERGPYHQRRMRSGLHVSARAEPLREAVVYSSFNGRQYSDGPRAIHEELVARGAPLEHLWVVRDGMCNVPSTASALREGSREYYEAIARARYVVGNDHYPGWFERRDGQVSVQTWHGVPLKPVGLDLPRRTPTSRTPADQGRNWSYVVSPNRFTTPILQSAYGVEDEMIETGYPRADALARPDREAAAAALRARLGLPEGKRVVLYAPTYRDRVRDARGRHRLDLRLDLDRMRDALGDDTVLLFRKHHYVIDPVPSAGGFVRDVSRYPDGVELMLAADVLVTDYSSLMFDFANTGRPMLFFTYDIDSYPRDFHSFYFDYAETAPGPLLRTADELTAALQDIGAVQAQHTAKYADFAARFCELDDGGATARVVDRIFGS
jgi:CDP-glycerol glycerophosphotransferase